MKSCENCKCGYWQMCDNEYGRYPIVLCYLHKNCGGDEPYRICEDEWVETAEHCKEYTDEKTIEETLRIAEEYKQELEDRWKVTKQKAQGVLDETLIERACEWLRNNWRKYINIDADGVVCFGHWENDFRKAMKED